MNGNFSNNTINKIFNGNLEEAVCQDIAVLLFAGTDTLSTTLVTIIYNLCKYPNIQERIYNEIKTILLTENVKQNSYSARDTSLFEYLNDMMEIGKHIIGTSDDININFNILQYQCNI